MPRTEELMAAGQLGGPLYPTHELKDKARQRSACLDFGWGIEAWNRHEYSMAVALFRKHAKDFPDSPWAGEALLHVGCDGTYNGRYTEAESIFLKLIADHQASQDPGAKMLVNKARQRLGLLKIEQNSFDEATACFSLLLQESPDWRQRTYAAHWLHTISRYKAAGRALLTCGAEALAYRLERDGDRKAAAQVRTNTPPSMQGHRMADLARLAAQRGYQLSGIQVKAADLPSLPLPAILHIGPQNAASTGHYWVLDRVRGNQLELFDPQSQHRFHQTVDELLREWTGRALVFSKGGPLPGRTLDLLEMESESGGCCGAPRREDDQGDPCKGKGSSGAAGGGSGSGAPVWKVNLVNMNLFVQDTPLWYDPPIGPAVRITLSYNSQSAIAFNEPFGNKWQFSYASYLIVDTSGTAVIFMPDGRRDVYNPDGTGGYRRPYQVFNTLTKIAENHFELRLQDDTVYVYDIPPGTTSQQPFLTEIRDAYGQSLTFGYDANVHLTTITEAQGKVFTLVYNAAGLCTSVADPFGRIAQFEYDANHNLSKITDMAGYWSTFTYDATVYLTSVGNDRGTWTFLIEPNGAAGNNSDNYPPPGDPNMFANYRITITNPLGQPEEFFYYGGCDIDGFAGCSGYTWYVSPRDYIPWQSQEVNNYRSRAPKTRYLFTTVGSGRQGEISKIVYPGGGFLEYGYDSDGNLASVRDAHGHTRNYSYNQLGQLIGATDAKSVPSSYGFAANGVDLTSVSNGLGIITIAYDNHHKIVSLTDRLTNTTLFAYNEFGQITNQVDPLGVTNTITYDSSHRMAAIFRDGKRARSFTYDPIDRIRTVTDEAGVTITNDYNGLNGISRVTYPDGRFVAYDYSGCCPDSLNSKIDRGGRTTFYQYDDAKRLVQLIGRDGSVIRYEYDAGGNQTKIIDPNGNVTLQDYDAEHRLVRRTYPDGRFITYTYDAMGLVTNQVTSRGITNSYTYDENHRLAAISHSDGTPQVSYTYDPYGRLIGTTDALGASQFAFDANSRLVRADGPWNGDSVTYAYDPLDRVTNLVAEGSQPIQYSYDTLDRLVSVQTGAAEYLYGYTGNSPWVQSLQRPNGSSTIYAYDLIGRISGLATRRSTGELLFGAQYSFNAQDLRASETVTNALAFTPAAERTTYQYNNLNQVLQSAPPTRLFAHDADGNLTGGFTPDAYPFSAVYDADNRLRQVVYTNSQTGVVYSNTYTYFANGLLGEWRLYQNSSLASTTRYVYDHFVPLQERDGANAITRQYTWGLSLGGGIGGLLALRQSGQEYSYLYDAGGNVTALLDPAQGVAAAYRYDTFGKLLARGGALDQPFLFSTRIHDLLTGLSYFAFRFYSPALGRWITRDPLWQASDVNLYEFARGNPANFRDWFGLYANGQPVPTDPNSDTISCKDGKLSLSLGHTPPGSSDYTCTAVHEGQHIKDWEDNYGPDVCKGVANGQLPLGGADYDNFIKRSECAAYKAGKKCRERQLTCDKDPNARKTAQDGINRDDAMIQQMCQ